MFIAIDIGGTNGRVVPYATTSSPDGLLPPVRFKTSGDYETDLMRLFEAIEDCQVDSEDSIEAIGLGIAGALSEDNSQVVAAGNLKHWVLRPFKNQLESQFQAPVTLGNDAYVNVLAELVYGSAPDDVLGITWGSGLGGCHGRTPAEPGHVIVDPRADNPPCGCPRSGCLESFVGGAKIEQKYGVDHAGLIDQDQLTEVIEAMADGLTSVLYAHPAPLVIFAGGVANKQPGWVKRIHDRLAQDYMLDPVPEFRIATFGENTGLVGALALLADN